jgi:hypothetical protein
VKRVLAFLALLSMFLARPALAQGTCEAGATCVPAEDVKVFVQLLKDQKCRSENPPTFALDPVVIVVDKDGRVYGSGNDPKPYKMHVDWCNYHIDANANVKLQVAREVPPTWGFRFRLKAAVGYLPVEALEEKDAGRGLDAGLMFEPFYFFRYFNLNAYVGVRSFGGGLGFDVTKNFGLYAGYALAWGTWRSNPEAALYFSFW